MIPITWFFALFAFTVIIYASFMTWLKKPGSDMKEAIKIIFISDDGRPAGEPVVIAGCFLLDYFFPGSNFTLWLAWWIFLLAIMSISSHISGNIIRELYGMNYCLIHYPDLMRSRLSHKTFLNIIYDSLFLYFWWKWIS